MNMGTQVKYPREAMVKSVTMSKLSQGEFESRVNNMKAKTQELIDSGMYRGEAASRLLDAAEAMRSSLLVLQSQQNAIANASNKLYDKVISAEQRRAVDSAIQANLDSLRTKTDKATRKM